MSKLKMAIEHLENAGGIHVIKPQGLIDIITSPVLDNCIEELINQGVFRIVVDMGTTSYISSAGWGIFIGSLRRIRENRGDIVFINMTAEISDFFRTLELPSKFRVFDNRDQAIAYFKDEKT